LAVNRTLSQPIEDVRTLAGKPVTVSWWMLCEDQLSVTCQLRQSFGGASPTTRVIAATAGGTAAIATNVWTQYTATFAIPALTGYSIGGVDSALILEFINPTGTYTIQYAQVQMEESAVATVFETYPVQVELSRCQRYFEYHAGFAVAADIETISIPIDLPSLANGNVCPVAYTPGYAFKILSATFSVTKPVTTAAKASTLTMNIGATPITGFSIALTSANCTPVGNLVASTQITAANTGVTASTVTLVAGSTTAFVEGQGVLLLKIQKLDTVKPCFYFATRKYATPVLTVLTGIGGTGMHYTALLDVGYYQDTPNSVAEAFFIQAEAEIKI
jgi:hypothetical protein